MSSSATDIREARAQSLEVRGDTLVVDFVDGRTMTVPIVWYPRLWYGTAEEHTISNSLMKDDISTGLIWMRT